MGWLIPRPQTMVEPSDALAGRATPAFVVPERHRVLDARLSGPWPEPHEVLHLAMGCFWGAEKAFWQVPGVISTAVGYMGGYTPNPTYEEVCTGRTGHTETVQVVIDPRRLPADEVLRLFWELHDPTQGFRQGADVGTQYRSAIFTTTPEQELAARRTMDAYAPALLAAGLGTITTQIARADDVGPFFYAEGYHQQYLDRVPDGYCPAHSTGVACPRP
jgi:peptide-methionine (S)-S-oxide reductase